MHIGAMYAHDLINVTGLYGAVDMHQSALLNVKLQSVLPCIASSVISIVEICTELARAEALQEHGVAS